MGRFTHGDKLVVSAPNLSCFTIHSYNVPELNAGDGFPCMKEVDTGISAYYFKPEEDYILNLMKQNLNTIFKAVRWTPVLNFSDGNYRYVFYFHTQNIHALLLIYFHWVYVRYFFFCFCCILWLYSNFKCGSKFKLILSYLNHYWIDTLFSCIFSITDKV